MTDSPKTAPHYFPVEAHEGYFECRHCGIQYFSEDIMVAHVTGTHDAGVRTPPVLAFDLKAEFARIRAADEEARRQAKLAEAEKTRTALADLEGRTRCAFGSDLYDGLGMHAEKQTNWYAVEFLLLPDDARRALLYCDNNTWNLHLPGEQGSFRTTLDPRDLRDSFLRALDRWDNPTDDF